MKEKYKDNSTKVDTFATIKYFKTVSLCLSFLCLGLCIAVVGPTLPTLAYNLKIHISTFSYILPSRAVGSLFGSIVGGLIYENFDPNLLIFLSLFVTACGTLVIPFFSSVALVAIACCIIGVSLGFLDTVGNVMCLQTWGEKSGPYLQTLHFSYAIGTTVAPLLATSFIMQPDEDLDMTTVATVDMTSISSLLTNSTSTTLERFYEVTYVFVCCASISLLVSSCFLYLACFHQTFCSDQKNTVQEEGTVFRIKILVFLFMFFLVYVGMEVTFGVYIYTFAIGSNYTKFEATALNTIFWGAYAVGRFIAIFASKFFSPTKLLACDLVGSFIASVLLACFPYYSESANFIFWIASGLYGLSLSSVFPTGITWTEQYITVTGKAAMVLIVGSAAGEIILPFVVGQYIETNPMFLMYFALVATCISIILFIILHLLAKTKGKRLKKDVCVDDADKQIDQNSHVSLNVL